MPPLNVEVVEVSHETPEEEQFVKNILAGAGFADVTRDNVDLAMAFLNNAFNSKLPLYMYTTGLCLPPMASRALITLINRGDFDADDAELLACSGISKMNAVVNKVVANKQTRKGKLIFCSSKVK